MQLTVAQWGKSLPDTMMTICRPPDRSCLAPAPARPGISAGLGGSSFPGAPVSDPAPSVLFIWPAANAPRCARPPLNEQTHVLAPAKRLTTRFRQFATASGAGWQPSLSPFSTSTPVQGR